MQQADLVKLAINTLEGLRVPYMVVGSLASTFWGEPRMTIDADIVIDPDEEQLAKLCESFPSEDFYVIMEAAKWAVRHNSQFNVIDSASGNKIDFMIARHDAWGSVQLSRRERSQLMPGVEGYIACPEDVVIAKLIYYKEGQSDKHLRDIAGVLKVSGDRIDRKYLKKWIDTLELGDSWELIPGKF